jgi:hypothetical protein
VDEFTAILNHAKLRPLSQWTTAASSVISVSKH